MSKASITAQSSRGARVASSSDQPVDQGDQCDAWSTTLGSIRNIKRLEGLEMNDYDVGKLSS